MTEQEILLKRGEYQEVDEGVKALVSTVVSKLPGPQSKKFEPLLWREQMLKKQAELVQEGVHAGFLSDWLGLDARKRTERVQYKILVEVQQLRVQHGAEAVTAALAKVCAMGEPQKATAPYLKAILRNGGAHASASPAAPGPVAPAARKIGREHWDRIMQALEQRINPRSFATWLRPCTLIEISKTALTIGAPSEVHVSWLNEHYIAVLSQAFAKVIGQMPLHLQIIEVKHSADR